MIGLLAIPLAAALYGALFWCAAAALASLGDRLRRRG
jgi:hypothetical protein